MHIFCVIRSLSSDTGTGQSETLPGTTTSYRVTGLRLGRRYRFTLQPTFQNQVGPETSVEERTGYTVSVSFSSNYRQIEIIFCIFHLSKLNNLNQEYSNLAREIHFPADFSCNPNQTHLNMLLSVFRIISKPQVGEFDQGWS